MTHPDLTGTWLEDLANDTVERLLEGSRLVEVAAGGLVHQMADGWPLTALVLAGTVRIFLTSADGRQVTVRYGRRGSMIGKLSTVIGAYAPLRAQAVTDAVLLQLDLDRLSRLAATDIHVAAAIISDLGRRLDDVYATVGDSAFGSIRQRLARHLLVLAGEMEEDGQYRVVVSQQQLADAIGSSREVVARELARLRQEGVVRTGQREIDLVQIDRLVAYLNEWRAELPS